MRISNFCFFCFRQCCAFQSNCYFHSKHRKVIKYLCAVLKKNYKGKRQQRIKEEETKLAIHANLNGSSSAHKSKRNTTKQSYKFGTFIWCIKRVIVKCIDITSHWQQFYHHHLYCFGLFGSNTATELTSKH